MRVFSGTKKCIKCGTTAPYSQYIAETSTRFHGEEQTVFPEYIKRTCRHCKYEWNEETRDAE